VLTVAVPSVSPFSPLRSISIPALTRSPLASVGLRNMQPAECAAIGCDSFLYRMWSRTRSRTAAASSRRSRRHASATMPRGRAVCR